VSYKSVILSQRLLEFNLKPGEEEVCSEFEDPRDASAVYLSLDSFFGNDDE
jgi:hypothetical protein